MNHIFLVSLFITLTASTYALPKQWKLLPQYKIGFTAGEFAGTFKKMTGKITFDTTDISQSSFQFIIDANTIDLGVPGINKDAKGEAWFNTKQYPNIQFTSRAVAKTPAGYQVTGELTVKGIKKEIIIPLAYTLAKGKIIFKTTFSLKRTDYEIGKQSTDVPPDVEMNIEIPAS
ncbi:MAG: YceI family protein [Chitinophagia bacterium]|nr:YceI family protein [Chitinophagia bacterium]